MTTATETLPEVSLRDEIIGLERDYLLQNYARTPIVVERGKGAYVFDTDGKRYLDFIAGIGVNALGYNHPRVTKVIRDQAAKVLHSSNLYYHLYQGPLAKRLAEASGLQRVFFSNSGTEAIEAALKMVRSHGRHINEEKFEIVALDNSFHGRTLGALSITGQPKYRQDFEPLLPGVKFVRLNDAVALEQIVTEKTAGIVLEGIQGEGGINPLTADFLHKARELADRYDAMLVFDEIQCGVGRTGTYFSYQMYDPVVMPDIVVAAKPIASGLPLGCLLANERAARSIGTGMHGTTFGGNALACRVAIEFFDILAEMLPAIERLGSYFRMRLSDLAKKHEFIKEVRGAGLMVGMELTAPAKQVVVDCMAQGLLINCTHDTVLRFLPPYIVTEKEIDKAVSILGKVLKKFTPTAHQ